MYYTVHVFGIRPSPGAFRRLMQGTRRTTVLPVLGNYIATPGVTVHRV